MRYLMSAATGLLLLIPAVTSPALDGPDIDKVAADWLYPKARDAASAGKASLYSTMFNTSDDVQTVLKHYAKKLRIDPGNTVDANSAIGVKTGTAEGGESFLIVKSTSATIDGVEEVVFTHQTKSALTTLILHRVRGGKLTRVTITHAELGGG
jgi:hypothetical protein